MYIPEPFAVIDRDKAFAFIQANGFGQLISSVEGRLFCSHLPFLLGADRSVLQGHVARGNPQWHNIEGQEVLVTFLGPHDYISPSWYAAPGVPTWNYQAVHVYGKCFLLTDSERLGKLLDRLTCRYENSFERPWQPEYDESLLNAVVGLEIRITDIQCKFKLSQNRSAEDQQRVAEQLRSEGSTQLSQAMENDL